MKNIYFSFILLLLCFNFQLIAQDDFAKSQSQILIGLNFQTLAQDNYKQVNNEVFINQIGNGNQVSTTIRSLENKSVYIQKGNYNNIYSNVNAKTYTSSIVQNGDRHKAFNFANSPEQDLSLELNQQGNSNHFEQFGSNSIGNKMKFQMAGNARSLIVRNFK